MEGGLQLEISAKFWDKGRNIHFNEIIGAREDRIVGWGVLYIGWETDRP